MSDIRNLETFAWVARLGGFRLAAARLHTTQPAVSARIAQLERELGVSLFEPKRRGALTPKGQELLVYAEKILQLRSEMVRQIRTPNASGGVLRLGALETIAQTWLTILLKRIRARYPAVTIQIEIDTTPKLRRALLAQDLDLTFHLGAMDDPRIRNLPVHSYPVAWIASPKLELPDRRLTLEDLVRWPIITSRPHVPHSTLIKKLLEQSFLPDAQLYSSTSIATIVHMTRDAIGVGIIPLVLVQRELQDGTLRHVETDLDLPPLDFTVSYPLATESPLAAEVAELAVEIAHEYSNPHAS